MNWAHIALLVAAGLLGGLAGSIAGLASVTTYPALLAVGLPPVTANITNTVAMVGNAVGSIIGSRPELRGQGPYLLRTVPLGVVGGVLGAVLLLSTPAEGFEKLVPLLIGFSSIAIVWPRRERLDEPREKSRRHKRIVLILEGAAILLIAIYGGYFGAAAGVLLLALLLRTEDSTLAQANAAKNVLLGAANGVAAVIFIVVAPVDWPSLVPLAIGCVVGSRLGPIVVRHAPATPIRWLIGAGGLALAIKLGLDAY
ncbi:MAG: sulfite exporter TauE/SafE family protein [Mycobacterium sp.]